MTSPKKRPVVVIACRVLQEVLETYLPKGLADRVHFMDYGLHRVPSTMTGTLQQALDSLPEPSLVVLGYGLCGNGLKGVQAREHTLLIPRVDDCIALLLGSYQSYMREFQAEPGTYYLTKGWLEGGSDPLKEYQEYELKYGPEQAQWLMDQQYQHYSRLMFVAYTEEDLAAYRPLAQEVARYCQRWGFCYEERLGSDEYVRRLVEITAQLSQNGCQPPPGLQGDFVLVSPGDEIRQDMFMR